MRYKGPTCWSVRWKIETDSLQHNYEITWAYLDSQEGDKSSDLSGP